LAVELVVDGERLDLNEFVEKFFGGTIAGALSSLRGVKKDWKEVKIKISR